MQPGLLGRRRPGQRRAGQPPQCRCRLRRQSDDRRLLQQPGPPNQQLRVTGGRPTGPESVSDRVLARLYGRAAATTSASTAAISVRVTAARYPSGVSPSVASCTGPSCLRRYYRERYGCRPVSRWAPRPARTACPVHRAGRRRAPSALRCRTGVVLVPPPSSPARDGHRGCRPAPTRSLPRRQR